MAALAVVERGLPRCPKASGLCVERRESRLMNSMEPFAIHVAPTSAIQKKRAFALFFVLHWRSAAADCVNRSGYLVQVALAQRGHADAAGTDGVDRVFL